MDLPSITEFLILTIFFDLHRKQLHTNYIYTVQKSCVIEQRIRLIVSVCYKQQSIIHILYYCTMRWGHQTQLCHVLPGPQFKMGKWPWKHPTESLATPLKLEENLQVHIKNKVTISSQAPCIILFFKKKPIWFQNCNTWILTEHVSFFFNSFSAKSIDCG